MNEILRVNNLYGGYHKDSVIRGISFGIKKGDFAGIIGPNGSGKTTLLRLLSKVLIPQNGDIKLDNADIRRMNQKEFAQKTAFVPQDTTINFSFTVFEIVLMGRIPHLRRMQAENEKDFLIAEKALLVTDVLHLKEKMINEISAGERQRVIIARALTQEPALLFLDEPTSHLDISHQVQILDLLRKLNRDNKLTVVMVLHDLNLAGEYCNRIIMFNEGRIFADGSPQEVLSYQNIEKVYKTIVVVNNNPITNKPYIFLVPQTK